MFAWPTLELTDYELKYVRYYKQPKLDSNGNITNETWPGVLKRVYTTTLYNQNIAAIPRFNNGPVFEKSVIISRRARVFGITFSGDTSAWFLSIETASGEKYTNAPCLVSSMCAGSYFNANANVSSPVIPIAGALPFDLLYAGEESFGIMIEPNYQLLPNEALIFKGSLAAGVSAVDPNPFTQLTIGVHAWEFPGMGYSKVSDQRSV